MKDTEVQVALAYNVRQGFTAAEIVVIQAVVGVEQLGAWDEDTIIGVAQFQEQEDIEPDGKVWRSDRGNTWPVIKAEAIEDTSIPPGFKIGMWVDDAPKTVLKPGYLHKAQDLGITSLALMLNKANTRPDLPPWELRWKATDLEKVCQAAHDLGMEIALTMWPQPSKKQLETMMADLMPLMGLPGLVAIEVDTEGNWHPRFLDGFSDMVNAGRYLATRMFEATNAAPGIIRTELTTFPSHTENGPDAVVAKFMNALLVQCYSVRHRERKNGKWEVPWSHRYGPGKMQEWGMGRAALVPGQRTSIACGIAAWDQEGWPGHTPEQAMSKAMRTAVACGATEARLWSSKWFVGHLAQQYVQNYLMSLR